MGCYPTYDCCLAGEALRRSRCEHENPATPVIALLNADLSKNFDESLRLRKSARKIARVTRCGRWGCACRKWARAVFKCSRRNSFEQALPERNQTRRLRPEHRLHLRRAAARTRTCHPLRDERLRHQPVSYTHLRAHETDSYLVCRLLLEKKKNTQNKKKTKKNTK